MPNSTKESSAVVGPGANGSTTFLPKVTTSSMKQQNVTSEQKKKSLGPLQAAGMTSMGPFYKKRGYASSQLEMRRESHN